MNAFDVPEVKAGVVSRLVDSKKARSTRATKTRRVGNAEKPRAGVRALRLEQTRRDLLKAATAVIGEVGYEKASVARITARARVAQGTFYTYFKSRQDLFDRLLPAVGEDMLARITERMHGASDLSDVEERGFRAMFEYLVENPGFYRLLNEAETLAPKAHAAHFKNLCKGYVHALEAAWVRGELSAYRKREIEALAYMLMGMRSYLILGFARKGRRIEQLPEPVTQTYLKFVRAAFKG